jgi:hypothetical protein
MLLTLDSFLLGKGLTDRILGGGACSEGLTKQHFLNFNGFSLFIIPKWKFGKILIVHTKIALIF